MPYKQLHENEYAPVKSQPVNFNTDAANDALAFQPNNLRARVAEPTLGRTVLPVSNEEFTQAIFPELPKNVFAEASTLPYPGLKRLFATRVANVVYFSPGDNNYVGCSSFDYGQRRSDRYIQTGKRKSDWFYACHFLLLRGLRGGTWIDGLHDLQPSWQLESGPGSFEVGIIFDAPITDLSVVRQLQRASVGAKLSPRHNSGPHTWAHLPESINGKSSAFRKRGSPFRCRLVRWQPDLRYTPRQIIERLRLSTKA